MPDDWEWFWAGEAGRDNMLRAEAEGAYREASRASQKAARLSSQLAQVQGSMETRLSALAAAFDAYVELGDVREQLSGYPDTSAVRRDATAAFAVLTRGGVPEPVTSTTTDYWLADAVNAVIARAGGRPDPEAEARAVALDRDAELFLVAAAGALGHGDQVQDRVPPLLVTDGELTAPQQALWSAVLAGEYGDVLPAVQEPWRPALAAGDAAWDLWARTQARTSTPLETLRWIERQVAASAPGAAPDLSPPVLSNGLVPAADLVLAGPEAETSADPKAETTARTGLGGVALTLVQRGLGEEVALLERARELRARIEQPQPLPTGRRPSPASAPAEEPMTVLSAVRAAFRAAPPGSPLRSELLTWVRPGLLAATAVLVAKAEASLPETVEARTPGGVVAIGPTGVTPEDAAKAESRVRERFAPATPYGRVVPAVVAGVLVVATILLGVAGATSAAVLAALGAIVAGVIGGRAVLAEVRRRGQLGDDLELTRRSLTETGATVQRLEAARLDDLAEARRLAAGLRDRLGALVG